MNGVGEIDSEPTRRAGMVETEWSKEKFDEKIKELTPAEQEAVKRFWRSVVMRTPRAFSEENGRLPHGANVRSCSCCPYGYHIDLDFVRYCESLANAKPSEEELRRRSRRRSRKSMEFMLGLDGLFDQWDAAVRVVQPLPEASNESDSPDSPRDEPLPPPPPQFAASTPYSSCSSSGQQHRPRSSSVPRFTYGGLTRSESPFGTASSTCSSLRGAESDCLPYATLRRPPANSPPETRAFLRDALDEVCSDFERTLERASVKRKKNPALAYSINGSGGWSDRNNNHQQKTPESEYHHQPQIQSSWLDKRNGNGNSHSWDQYSFSDSYDSCVTGNKSPRSSRVYSGTSATLPFQKRLSPAEQQYEQYVQATVAANAKSPVEELLPAPPPPPRRHALTAQLHAKLLTSPVTSTSEDAAKSPAGVANSQVSSSPSQSPSLSTTTVDGPNTDAQTLYNIRQQMALSLKRMKDLEEQVKAIPELECELTQMRDEKERLQQSLQRKEEELQRARETTRFSASPSPVASPKYASSGQFTPQRISPISLDSLGARLRTSSTSSDKQAKVVLKRDVGTMCGLHTTRDVAVGSPVLSVRSTGTSPAKALHITDLLYTKLEMDENIEHAIAAYEEKRSLQQLKKLISVGTQMYVPKKDLRSSGVQTAAEKPTLKYSIGVTAAPSTRENFVTCKPDVRTVGCSEDRISDVLCERCAATKRTVACGTDETIAEKPKMVSLKLLDSLPGRSNTFSLGDNEKLNIKRKTVGTQYTPVEVYNAGNQTAPAVVHSIGVQSVPDTQNMGTQSQVDILNRHTDTRDLIRLSSTQTSVDEIAAPMPPKPQPAPAPPKPQTRAIACNTEMPCTADYGINTLPSVTTRHSSSNTEEVHKRDIGCGDVVKPHISIACADNYCDSCKDAIKNLAKDFSKVTAPSPVPTRAADSKIPRPKHLTSPSPVRRQIQRQNTYTITPSPTPSPNTEKKSLISSLHEKPPAIASFHQIESSSETQSFITEPTSQKVIVSSCLPVNSPQPDNEPKPTGYQQDDIKSYDITNIGENDLIVREQKRVSISWSRDASPAPLAQDRDGSPMKSLESSFNEQVKKSLNDSGESTTDVSKGARKKTSPLLSSQTEDVEKPEETLEDEKILQKPPTKALLHKLAMVEAEPRQKIIPSSEMLAAMKIINDSLLKKLGAKPFSSTSLKSSKTAIQQEWFRISSTDKANPHEVEDYLDCFEESSVPLLEYCVNLSDANGNTAMHYAVSHGNFDVVSILLDSKVCNVNQMNNAGYTCVMLVSLAKLKNAEHRTVVERLFQMADVNIRAKKHCQTALMLAVSHGNLDMVEMLLAAGADINIQDEDGSTALMCAAEHGRVDIVKHLLSQTDCDSLVQDMDGSTAFKIAWQAGYRDIGLLLYVHEQMLRSKMPNRGESTGQRTASISPRALNQHKRQPSQ